MDKLETAAGIYKYGMKNVPITDPNIKVSQELPLDVIFSLTVTRSFNNCMTESHASCLQLKR
jgi:hypothetical protein